MYALYSALAYEDHESMILGVASTPSNESAQQQTINVENVEQVSGNIEVTEPRNDTLHWILSSVEVFKICVEHPTCERHVRSYMVH